MMRLVDILSDGRGLIHLSPCGDIEGALQECHVDIEWFMDTFPKLAVAICPLDNDSFMRLKSIDEYWCQNAERWRSEGLI